MVKIQKGQLNTLNLVSLFPYHDESFKANPGDYIYYILKHSHKLMYIFI